MASRGHQVGAKKRSCYHFAIIMKMRYQMPNVTIRNLPDETHRAIKARARRHGRSTEAEIREILKAAAQPPGTLRLGDELAALGAAFGGVEIRQRRSTRPMRAAKLA